MKVLLMLMLDAFFIRNECCSTLKVNITVICMLNV